MSKPEIEETNRERPTALAPATGSASRTWPYVQRFEERASVLADIDATE